MYFNQWTDNLSACLSDLNCKIQGISAIPVNSFELVKKILMGVKAQSKKVGIIGNGGSAAIACHISQDMINKLGIASFVLTDAALITCIGNDFGYENVFSKSLDVMLNEDDLLIAISDSGESKNILNAVQVAKKNNCKIMTLSAFKNNNTLFMQSVDVAFHIKTENYGLAEISHLTILHALVDELSQITLQKVIL